MLSRVYSFVKREKLSCQGLSQVMTLSFLFSMRIQCYCCIENGFWLSSAVRCLSLPLLLLLSKLARCQKPWVGWEGNDLFLLAAHDSQLSGIHQSLNPSVEACCCSHRKLLFAVNAFHICFRCSCCKCALAPPQLVAEHGDGRGVRARWAVGRMAYE